MTDNDTDWKDEEESVVPVDPRTAEMVEYAATTVELVLNAEFLLDDWVTTYIQARPDMYRMARRCGMTPAQKLLLVMGESGACSNDEFGGQEAFGFLCELLRLRAKTSSETEDRLLDGLTAAYVRHGGEEAREDCAESFDRLGMMKPMVADYLDFAYAWIRASFEMICEDSIGDDYFDAAGDPGWEPREDGGSCNFIMCDP